MCDPTYRHNARRGWQMMRRCWTASNVPLVQFGRFIGPNCSSVDCWRTLKNFWQLELQRFCREHSLIFLQWLVCKCFNVFVAYCMILIHLETFQQWNITCLHFITREWGVGKIVVCFALPNLCVYHNGYIYSSRDYTCQPAYIWFQHTLSSSSSTHQSDQSIVRCNFAHFYF